MKHGAAIVNVSSVHAHATEPNVSHYAASKGGIEAFTRALSREHDPARVRVNCVAPGGVDTPMFWTNPAVQAMRPEERVYAQPEQIAAVICFLASEEAGAINGATVVADKGVLAAL